MKINKITTTLLSVLLLTACSKDDESTSVNNNGSAKIEFDNSINGDDLILESTYYTKANNETYAVTDIKYIISNIVLISDKGEEYIVPKDESYYIVNEKVDSTMTFELKDIPAGKYTQIKIGLGVDQAKYLQGASGQGDLIVQAEAAEMMWAWQAGYRFVKFEGNYKTATNSTAEPFKYHVGSHGSSLDNFRETTLSLPIPALVEEGKLPTIHIVADLAKLFNAAHELNINDNPQIMVNPTLSPKVIDNAVKMFEVHHVHN
ncbi:MAG: MbnP family protein [Flavobacteriales bacterium]